MEAAEGEGGSVAEGVGEGGALGVPSVEAVAEAQGAEEALPPPPAPSAVPVTVPVRVGGAKVGEGD